MRGAGEQAGTYITNRRVDLQVGVCADFYSYLVLWYSALRPQRLQCTKRCRVARARGVRQAESQRLTTTPEEVQLQVVFPYILN